MDRSSPTGSLRILLCHGFGSFSLAGLHLATAARAVVPDALIRLRSYPVDQVASGILFDVHLFRPDVVGLSIHFWSAEHARLLARTFKAANPSTLVVVGGPHVGSLAEARELVAEERAFDAAVSGDGEEAFAALVGQLAGGLPPAPVPGAAVRCGEGVVATPARGRRDLATLPPGIVPSSPWLAEMLEKASMASVETVRGCVRGCTYCVGAASPLRLFPTERARGELTHLCGLRLPEIRVADSHFGGDAQRAKELLEHIASVNVATTFSLYPHPAHLDSEYVGLLRRARCAVVSLGVQSTSARLLGDLRRQQDLDEVERAIAVLREGGIEPQVDVILGLPGEQHGSLEATVSWLERLGVDRVLFSPCMVFPGTTLARRATALGIETSELPARYVLHAATLPPEVVRHGYRLAAWHRVLGALPRTRTVMQGAIGPELCAALARADEDARRVDLLHELAQSRSPEVVRALADRACEAMCEAAAAAFEAEGGLALLADATRADVTAHLLTLLPAIRPQPGAPREAPLAARYRTSPRVVRLTSALELSVEPLAAGPGPRLYAGVPTSAGPAFVPLDALDDAVLEAFEEGADLAPALGALAARGFSGKAVEPRVRHWSAQGLLRASA